MSNQNYLVTSPTTLKSTEYIKILGEVMAAMVGENFIFGNDNFRMHTANSDRSYLISKNIRVLGWLANSPSANIIENMWATVKKRLQKESVQWECLGETAALEFW